MKKLTSEEFIERSNIIHNNNYDYSKVKYINIMSKVIIICHIHGEFEQTPQNHLNNHICKKCSSYGIGISQKKDVEFYTKSQILYSNKYDYTKSIYSNRRTKMIIICPIHGEFLSTPMNHSRGDGCIKCNKEDTILKNKFNFIERSKMVHYNKYNYEFVRYTNDKVKVMIICSKHGEFLQQPNTHLNGVGCPSCSSSKGELKIQNFLVSNKVLFIKEHKFNECFYINSLPFDFYLPELNICIEFDGKQHFKPVNFFGGVENYNKIKIRDSIKNKYCMENNIKIIRIIYSEYNKIDKILKDKLWENY